MSAQKVVVVLWPLSKKVVGDLTNTQCRAAWHLRTADWLVLITAWGEKGRYNSRKRFSCRVTICNNQRRGEMPCWSAIYDSVYFFMLLRNSATTKKTPSHCQLSLFSANLTCKYLCDHNKIQQLRQKLKFHRHVTNRNGIMCPWTKGVRQNEK